MGYSNRDMGRLTSVFVAIVAPTMTISLGIGLQSLLLAHLFLELRNRAGVVKMTGLSYTFADSLLSANLYDIPLLCVQ